MKNAFFGKAMQHVSDRTKLDFISQSQMKQIAKIQN